MVVGSGSAGSTAAIAAARTGASVVLIENGFLGGTSTAVLDTFYGFSTPGSAPRKIVGGIPDDVVASLRRLGPVVERPNTYGAGTGITYHPEHLKVAWEELVVAAGVRVLLHAFLADVVVCDGRVTEVVVATKAGLVLVAGRVFVDASGDADLAPSAGSATSRPASWPRRRRSRQPSSSSTSTGTGAWRSRSDKLHGLMAQAAASGAYDLPRLEGSDHVTPVEGMTATVMTRLPSFEAREGRCRRHRPRGADAGRSPGPAPGSGVCPLPA